jgi:hypothetical protein
MTEFQLMRQAAACLACIPSERRGECLVELLRLLGVQRDGLREIVNDDRYWAQRLIEQPTPRPPVEPEPPRRTIVGTIFYKG